MAMIDFLEITSRKCAFMTARIKSKSDHQLIIEVTIPLERSMLEGEGHIEQALNEAGTVSVLTIIDVFTFTLLDGHCMSPV